MKKLCFSALLFTLSVSPLVQAQPHQKYFAQVAVGGGAETLVTVHNPGPGTITVSLELVGSDGVVFAAEIFSVEPLATTTRIHGGAGGEARAGWAVLDADGEFESMLFYRIPGVGNVGVAASHPALDMTLLHTVEGADTGLAVANPSKTESVEISFQFRNAQGGPAAERTSSLVLAPLAHRAFLLTEAPFSVLLDGSTGINSSGPVIAVALRLDGGLLSGVPVLLGSPFRWEADSRSPNIIVGNQVNSVDPQAYGATVSGGGAAVADEGDLSSWITEAAPNLARTHYATVGGGAGNVAGAEGAGLNGALATVGGGLNNEALGLASTIPGGAQNRADGDFSLAAGRNARALHEGVFVWADPSPYPDVRPEGPFFSSHADFEFAVRASGGFRLISGHSPRGDDLGVELSPGSGSWASLSDRGVKEDFRPVDAREILQRLLETPVQSWRYQGESEEVRHLGPTSQDFRDSFGLGLDDRHITGVDADGVLMAALQGLYGIIEEQRRELQALKQQLQGSRSQGGGDPPPRD